MNSMFKRILIANRGEIAVRIIRCCKEMGIETVAVYSEADREALHVRLADQAVCIGAARAADSYLKQESIVAATMATGCDAIHPGYGFLSENSDFVRLCDKCGVTFIGPTADCMDALGNKNAARKLVMSHGVMVVPGSEGLVPDARTARTVADMIGYPVLLKASAGGGGRGMRRAYDSEEVEAAFNEASAEAKACFGNGDMYLEKLIENPRHVEVQILGDTHGNVIHLGERDCSIQRRNQKLVEEAPSPALPENMRQAIGAAAVAAAKAAGYTSAGTVEFVVDKENRFYFIEMNTRVQVEHPVSEFVTGVDIVREQIRIAAGMAVSVRQKDIQIKGHAIECRINAEIPEKDFAPNVGKIRFLNLPGGNGVRVDTALYNGYETSPYYDSLLAKVIVHGATRREAIQKMKRALSELTIDGVRTNAGLSLLIMGEKNFVKGNYNTKYMEEHLGEFLSLEAEKAAEEAEGPEREELFSPELYTKCGGCKKNQLKKAVSDNFMVCPECGYHFSMSASKRIRLITDPGSFRELNKRMEFADPIDFPGYSEKYAQLIEKTGLNDAVVTGVGRIDGYRAVLAVMDSRFLMASMGSIVGEKITAAVEYADKKQLPLIIYCASGGARMQEGMFSLMQMAKTSAAVERFSKNGGLYIAVLTNPTTGGVTASFASLADVTLAESGALIGFAGPRVIEQTIKATLPEGFQRAEYLVGHGYVDQIVARDEQKETLARLLMLHGYEKEEQGKRNGFGEK